MGLLSFFSKPKDASREAPPTGDPVAQARVRARRRLIGAALLVGAGIIGFPLLFETQPRPIAVDMPIVIPRKEAVAPLTPPKPRAQPAAPTESAEPAVPAGSAAHPGAEAAPPREAVINETRADAGREVAPPRAAASAPPARPAAVEKAPPARVEAKPEPKPDARAEARADEASRAKALLEGKDLANARAVVQVGAFADAAAARDVRQRVEKLGLKTYTQVVETSDGKRIRVRVGPFGSRDEADKAVARLKAAGLSAAVLAL